MIKSIFLITLFFVQSLAYARCEIIESGAEAPHGDKRLSKYWAQEFTGADLVREELSSWNLEIPKDLIGVWDVKPRGVGSHGERVSHLIMGPYPSALIPSESVVRYQDVEYERDIMEPADKFEKLFRDCLNRSSCPEFLNNSISWLKSDEIKSVVTKMAEKGILVVTSAGNARGMVESGKRDLARRDQIVLVGNTNIYGFPAKYTDSAPEVTVSAPSDNCLTTHDYEGNLRNFSGTSGSAPQVLASLASFRLVAGIKVDGELARLLLQSTAMKILPQPNNIGAGSLNAYKIFELAKYVKRRCSGRSITCAKSIVKTKPELISNREIREIRRDLQKVFPYCAAGSTYDRMFPTDNCKKRRMTFKNLRKLAHLLPDEEEYWEILHCVTGEEGLTLNAQFYKNLYRHVGKSNAEKIADYYKFNTDADLIKYSLSNPGWVTNPRSVFTVVTRARADWTFDNYLLAHEEWREYFTKFLEENDQPADALSASKIREFL